MKDREERIAHHRNYCRHYEPKPGASCYCALGCQPVKVMTPSEHGGMLKWGPCIGGHTLENPAAHCPKWEQRTREEGERYADQVQKSLDRLTKAGPVVAAWRKKQPIGKAEVIECPVCNGRLHLSQSSYNGHVRGRCETNDCLNWIE